MGSSLFTDGGSAVGCDFGVLVRGDELRFLLLCRVISSPPCLGGKKLLPENLTHNRHLITGGCCCYSDPEVG